MEQLEIPIPTLAKPLLTLSSQDLKQQKFVIEAEPSETVRDYHCARGTAVACCKQWGSGRLTEGHA